MGKREVTGEGRGRRMMTGREKGEWGEERERREMERERGRESGQKRK